MNSEHILTKAQFIRSNQTRGTHMTFTCYFVCTLSRPIVYPCFVPSFKFRTRAIEHSGAPVDHSGAPVDQARADQYHGL